MPLPDLIAAIQEVPKDVSEAASRLACTELVVVNLVVKRSNIHDAHWTYFYDEDIFFTRLSTPYLQSPQNVPAGCSSLQAECYYSKKYRPLDREPNECIEPVIQDLKKCGILRDDDEIVFQNTLHTSHAQVIFDLERADAVATVQSYLDDVGIDYCGRYGDWAYIWTDESFLSGERAADRMLTPWQVTLEIPTMKVVLFCGGLGMRMREFSEVIPKPMAQIGYRPLVWHVMKYYAHFGHTDFIVCLGYRGDAIKEYFLNYNECASNDFVLSGRDRKIELLKKDIDEWQITFTDTGLKANIGQRLLAAKPFVAREEVFLANYADGLSDVPLDRIIEVFQRSGKIACFVAVNPASSFHTATLDDDGVVQTIEPLHRSGLRINGGYFVFRQEIFDFIQEGENLVEEPFRRLIAARQLIAYPYDGFWACMDTFKEKQQLEELYTGGAAPWEVWRSGGL